LNENQIDLTSIAFSISPPFKHPFPRPLLPWTNWINSFLYSLPPFSESPTAWLKLRRKRG